MTNYYDLNLSYRTKDIEKYMKLGIKEFVGIEELTLKDQSLRIQLSEKYFYNFVSCKNPKEFEYYKLSDNIIERLGKLKILMHLFNVGVLSAKQTKELTDKLDTINDQYDSCIIHNSAIKEID